jgi:putative tricarboxylic transport membrane protein
MVTARLSIRDSLLSIKEWAEVSFTVVRSSLIGFFVGLLPGSGATMASFMAYIAEMRLNKHPERLGKGALAGVAAPESANNAASMGAFAPLLSLGIPGSGTTALLLGGLMMWGLAPGPLLFREAPEFVWGLMASMYVGDIAVLLLCVLLVPFLAYIPRVPKAILAPTTIALCVLGSFSVNNSIFDIWFMVFMGVVGYFMDRLQFPTPPLVLALVLAPRLQTAFRQALMISPGGSPMIFITKPISLAFLLAAIVMVTLPVLIKKKKDSPSA